MRLCHGFLVLVLTAAISLIAAPRAAALVCQPDVPVRISELPPELSDPPIPHSGEPRISTVCIRSVGASGPAAATSPVEFWCTLAVWPPTVEVGGLFMDAAAGVLCNGPILGMRMSEQMYEVLGQTQTPFGPAFPYAAVGPVIWGAITAPCALFPWQRPTRVMINTAFVAVFAIDPASDGTLFEGTYDEPQSLTC